MTKVCIVEGWDAAAKIIYASKRSTGVLLMGSSGDAKGRFAYSTLEGVVESICLVSTACSLERLKQAFKDTRVVCASLTAKDMRSRARRRSIAATMRKAGARAVYVVYLYDATPMVPKKQPPIPFLEIAPDTDKIDKVIVAI